tara:strand:- start:87 stop:1196 length:1110 start_codon:yes stop_codon:yes gene_type:complete
LQNSDNKKLSTSDRRRLAVKGSTNSTRQKLLFIIIGGALLIIAAILAAGYIVAFVMPPREVVIKVNDTNYSRGDLIKVLRVRQEGAKFFGMDFEASKEIFEALQLFIEDEILTQVAAKWNITVTDDEISRQIESLFIIGDTDFEIEIFRRDFEERYRDYLNQIRLTEDEHREVTRRSIQRGKFREFIGEQVPAVAEHVHVHRIVMPISGEIDIMATKLNDGLREANTPEERQLVWKAVAREFSWDDAEIKRLGGDIGWMPSNSRSTYADKITSLDVGQLSEPIPDVENPKSILFFMISEKDTARQLSVANLEEQKTLALQSWINNERENHEIYARFDSEIYTWLLEQLKQSTETTPTPASGIDGLNLGL